MILPSSQSDPGSWDVVRTPRTTSQQPGRREHNSHRPRGTPGLSSSTDKDIVLLENIVIHPSQPIRTPCMAFIFPETEVESFGTPDAPYTASTAHLQSMENAVDSNVTRRGTDLNPDAKPFGSVLQFPDPSPDDVAQSVSQQLPTLESVDLDHRIQSATTSPSRSREESDGWKDRLDSLSSEASHIVMEGDHYSLYSLAHSLVAHPRPFSSRIASDYLEQDNRNLRCVEKPGLSSGYPQKEKIVSDAETALFGFEASVVPKTSQLLRKQEERSDNWKRSSKSLEEKIIQTLDSEFRF